MYTVHYVLDRVSAGLKKWPDGVDSCIFCGKAYHEEEGRYEEFCRTFNAKRDWEFSRKYKTKFCRDDNEIMALWVMKE